MTSDRMEYLLKEASDMFKKDADPFCTEFLCEHKVTADECHDLSQLIGLSIEAILTLKELSKLGKITIALRLEPGEMVKYLPPSIKDLYDFLRKQMVEEYGQDEVVVDRVLNHEFAPIFLSYLGLGGKKNE